MSAVRIAVKDRVANGLCPRCGKESAPYYLCYEHRQEARLLRALKRCVNDGSMTVEKRADRQSYYSIGHGKVDHRWGTPIVPPDHDGRFKPRIGRVPVDVERTLIKILTDANKPCTIEEILSAWGRLRTERKHDSVVGDLAAIIAAQKRRTERQAKRARVSLGTEGHKLTSLQAVTAEDAQP